jgi:hypothetical protein
VGALPLYAAATIGVLRSDAHSLLGSTPVCRRRRTTSDCPSLAAQHISERFIGDRAVTHLPCDIAKFSTALGSQPFSSNSLDSLPVRFVPLFAL